MEDSYALPAANQLHHKCTHMHHRQIQDLIPHLTFQNWMKNSALNLNTKIVALLPF